MSEKAKTKLRWGTAYFRSSADAKRYYAQHGTDYRLPLSEGSIHVGIMPPYNPKTERVTADIDGRYWIEEI